MALLDIYRYKKQGNPWMSNISMESNMLIAEKFLSKNTDEYGKHPIVSTEDGGTWHPRQAGQFLKLQHHIHSAYEKSIIERMIQYTKIELKDLMIIFLVK